MTLSLKRPRHRRKMAHDYQFLGLCSGHTDSLGTLLWSINDPKKAASPTYKTAYAAIWYVVGRPLTGFYPDRYDSAECMIVNIEKEQVENMGLVRAGQYLAHETQLEEDLSLVDMAEVMAVIAEGL